MRVHDLFSGLGGASQAFLDHGHDVVRIENNPLLSGITNTCIMGVDEFLNNYAKEGGNVDLLIMCPPCKDFSLARGERIINPDLTNVKLCKKAVEIIKPRYYIIENVRGAIPFFNKVLGSSPIMKMNPWYFWGRFPTFAFPHRDFKKTDGGRWSTDPLRANERAKWPIELSQAFLKAYENQTTLEEWLDLAKDFPDYCC